MEEVKKKTPINAGQFLIPTNQQPPTIMTMPYCHDTTHEILLFSTPDRHYGFRLMLRTSGPNI